MGLQAGVVYLEIRLQDRGEPLLGPSQAPPSDARLDSDRNRERGRGACGGRGDGIGQSGGRLAALT